MSQPEPARRRPAKTRKRSQQLKLLGIPTNIWVNLIIIYLGIVVVLYIAFPWGLYLMRGTVSTITFLMSVGSLVKTYHREKNDPWPAKLISWTVALAIFTVTTFIA